MYIYSSHDMEFPSRMYMLFPCRVYIILLPSGNLTLLWLLWKINQCSSMMYLYIADVVPQITSNILDGSFLHLPSVVP